MHDSSTPSGAPGAPPEAPRRKEKPAGGLHPDRLSQYIGRLGFAAAVVMLSGIAVAGAVVTSMLVWPLIFGTLPKGVPIVAAIVTVTVGTPIIAYAQIVIRKLGASKRALEGLSEHLALARDEAERANRAKSSFLAHMSHELRTPLNAIIGFSEAVRGEIWGPLGDKRYQDYAKHIHDSGQHLLSIINDILDLSKIEAGKLELDRAEPVELAAAVATAAHLVAGQAAEKSVQLTIEAPHDTPLLLGSERMLHQILLNLLSNAVKFTPPGGRVTVRAARTPRGEAAIAVSDSGIGMTRAEIGVALTPFGQVDGNLARRYEGTGLGLPLAKAMVELHKGALHIDSTPGEGTTVTIAFPAACLVERPPATATGAAE